MSNQPTAGQASAASPQGSSRSCQTRRSHTWEAVAQTLGQPVSAVADSSGVGDGCVLNGGVTVVGAVSGPHGGHLVTMKLGEIVGHHH
jgi:hypothetical protein